MAILANHLVEKVRSGFLPREPRMRVHVAARMCAGGSWTDITILNISSRGLMARTEQIPPARSYVEIRRGAAVTIVGKVVWHDDRHFGIRAQDRITLAMMADGGTSPESGFPSMERRSQRRPGQMDPAEAFERSRQRAALLQFAIFGAGGIGGAVFLCGIVMQMLGAPLAEVASRLG
jgi:hypothetical protein